MAVEQVSPTINAAGARRSSRSARTKKIRRQERLAKGVLWFFSGLTIVTLFTIVGYILVNGFYTRDVEFSTDLSVAEERVPLGPDTEQSLAVIVHPRLRIESIRFEDLRALVQNPTIRVLKHTWGVLTGQEYTVRPATIQNAVFRDALEEAVLSEEEFWEDMQFMASPQQVIEFVGENRGGLGLIPADAAADASGVKVIGVRRISVVVNPQILEIQEQRRLRELTPKQIKGLFAGEIATWSEVGGPRRLVREENEEEGIGAVFDDLAVVPVLLRTGNEYYDRLSDVALGEAFQQSEETRYVDSLEEFERTIRAIQGAVGLTYSPIAVDRELPMVETQLVHHQRNLRLSFLFTPPSRAGETGGISTIIVNTLIYILMTLLFATPVGIAAAVYLVEYARQGPLVRLLRIGTDTLAGIPSIIFGLFGLVVFAQFFGLKTGLISGTLTVTLMILPTIVRTSEEALKTVSRELREGSMALGATKLQTILRVVIPAATPGILTGMILAVGRAVGETAAVLYTIGSNMQLVQSLNSPVRVLTIHLYMLIREGISIPNAFASATILVVIVFLVNFSTRRLIAGRKALSGK